jgi:hypothetical protein
MAFRGRLSCQLCLRRCTCTRLPMWRTWSLGILSKLCLLLLRRSSVFGFGLARSVLAPSIRRRCHCGSSNRFAVLELGGNAAGLLGYMNYLEILPVKSKATASRWSCPVVSVKMSANPKMELGYVKASIKKFLPGRLYSGNATSRHGLTRRSTGTPILRFSWARPSGRPLT